MVEFPLHSLDSAPEAARPSLLRAQDSHGTLRNMYRVLAESPVALDAYQRLSEAFAESRLTPLEQQVVYLTAAHKNQCHYCTAMMSAQGETEGYAAISRAVREERPLADSRLQALRSFTAAMVEQRGWVADATVEMFLDAGFDRSQILEVITGIGLVTIGSYANHIAATPVDGIEWPAGRLAS
jgi:alkylhydroperoxidase family enzyme